MGQITNPSGERAVNSAQIPEVSPKTPQWRVSSKKTVGMSGQNPYMTRGFLILQKMQGFSLQWQFGFFFV